MFRSIVTTFTAICRWLGNLLELPVTRRLPLSHDQTIRKQLSLFLGDDYDRLETHDKRYPGYDIASLNRAVLSFLEECCFRTWTVGASGVLTVRILFDMLKNPYQRDTMAGAPTYLRVPVDVEQEGSFACNVLYLAEIWHEGDRHGERVAFMLATTSYAQDYWDGMDTRNVPQQQLILSIASPTKALADKFFDEIERRRQRLNIYRGKVIDPVVGPGGVHTIGFRAIHKVREEDLVLPQEVKRLIHHSILGFYNHRETLEALGIDMKRGVLFHSPPGTGKTSISLYLAGRLPNFTVCFVSGERLLYPREICRMARYLQPAMVVFEDIDLVALERDGNGLATVLGELMNQIDGCEPTEQVLFVMNTNSLARLEHAVKNRPGRIDQIIDIPLPDREERLQLLRHFAQKVALAVPDPANVLDRTEGATPAMLKEIVKRAVVSAVERDGDRQSNGQLAIEESDLLLATEQVRALRDPEVVPGSFGFRDKPRS